MFARCRKLIVWWERSRKLNYSICDLPAISGILIKLDRERESITVFRRFIVLRILIVAPGRCTRRGPFGCKVRNNDDDDDRNDDDDGTVCHRFLRRRARFGARPIFPQCFARSSERSRSKFSPIRTCDSELRELARSPAK